MVARTILAVAAAAVLAACTGDDASRDDGEAASQSVASAVEASSELARLVAPLEATPDLLLGTRAEAIAKKIDDAIARFRLFVAADGCLSVSRGLTFLAVTFTACRFALVFRLDGSLRADVDFDVDILGKPITLALVVTTPGLVVAGPLRTRRVAGRFELRQPLALAAPVGADLELEFETDAGSALALSAQAEWTIAGACATITGGGAITGEALGALGPVAIAERAVHACRNTCPDQGTVELSFGLGQLLRWTYTGAGTAAVIGPRGRELEVPLACGGDG